LLQVATNPVHAKRYRRTSIDAASPAARLHTVPIEKEILMIVSTLRTTVLLGLRTIELGNQGLMRQKRDYI
jgi:hypothetical protein